MAVSEQDFKNTLRLWASGVTVVTAKSEQEGVKGMTATSFSSVSLEPPQILVCIHEKADTGKVILEQNKFAVNILNSEQQDVSNQFAGANSQEERFANVDWEEGKTGSPVLKNSLASLECTLVQQVKAGTHWIVIGQVESVTQNQGAPLLYFDSAYRNLAED
ncbi:flavin reductase family protein [methane-oxidizing endosymbiont of Gigantopelta aegis]|uniref:flavin reductase family protein n=1 Tax=methane-oxidizing endosymbiont of Gigantopelta aegis TaxID=2794938 RepID=UPI0018DC2A3B|nr:flavin reductase family protein [methane-oxidizing endosymbiont of Gigantopelta aegis]